jgi:hypothetical protein
MLTFVLLKLAFYISAVRSKPEPSEKMITRNWSRNCIKMKRIPWIPWRGTTITPRVEALRCRRFLLMVCRLWLWSWMWLNGLAAHHSPCVFLGGF